jgi:hypothetical protein
MNLVTPEGTAKLELLFNKPVSEAESDLSIRTKCDQIYINHCYGFGHTHLLFNKPVSEADLLII